MLTNAGVCVLDREALLDGYNKFDDALSITPIRSNVYYSTIEEEPLHCVTMNFDETGFTHAIYTEKRNVYLITPASTIILAEDTDRMLDDLVLAHLDLGDVIILNPLDIVSMVGSGAIGILKLSRIPRARGVFPSGKEGDFYVQFPASELHKIKDLQSFEIVYPYQGDLVACITEHH